MHDTDCARNILEYYKLTPFGREKKNRNRNKKLVRQVLVYGDKGFWSPRIRTWAKKHNIDYQAIPKLKKPDTNTKIGWELWKEQYGYIVDAIKGVRWVVERTFAWLQKYRRLNMNYERTISSLEVMTILAAIRMILRRKMV
jgi:hypothetical protein